MVAVRLPSPPGLSATDDPLAPCGPRHRDRAQDFPQVTINAKSNRIFIATALVAALTGCAGSVKGPHIDSPAETHAGGIGTSISPKGVTGEISNCDAGMEFQVKSRRDQAYAAIAAACKGEDETTIVGDLSSGGQARTVAGGMETGCPGLAGRRIIFKCNGEAPRPSGLRSDQHQWAWES